MGVELVKTGIKGFDGIMKGGIPKGHILLLAGPIGANTELFALEFVYRGALSGEKTMYVSFEKNQTDLEKLGNLFNWKISEQIKAKNLFVLDSELFNYEQFLSSLEEQIFSYKISRVVIDSINFLNSFFENAFKYRKSLDDLRRLLKRHECTALLISESTGDELSKAGIAEFIADGIIHLKTTDKRGQLIHSISIPEMAGREISSQLYPIETTKTGIRVRERPLIL